MVSKEYLIFFQKYYRDSKPLLDSLTPQQQKKLRGKASAYLPRIKKQILQDMQNLATLASVLPEKHLAAVFTAKTVKPLIRGLLQPATGPYPTQRRINKDEKKLWEQRRERIQVICRMMIEELSDVSNAIAPKAYYYLGSAHRGQDFTEGLRALLVGE